MNKIRKLWASGVRINLPVSLALILAASLALTVAMFFIQPVSLGYVRESISTSPAIFFLNWIPILVVMLFLFFLTNNTVISCGVTGLLVAILSIVNRNMIAMRYSPFKPYDIMLGGEFLGVARSIDKRLFIVIGLGALLFIAIFVCCLRLMKNNRLSIYVRAGGAIVMLAAAFAVNKACANKSTYEKQYVKGNPYNETDVFNSRGFLYCFMYSLNNSRIVKPETYTDDIKLIQNTITNFSPADISGQDKPHIIFILSEAFSEMPFNDVFSFDGYPDPLEHYKQIKQEAWYGSLVVPGFGGGTADTEFDILTGLSTVHFRSQPYSFNMIAKPFPSVASLLSDIGYANISIHPGDAWFYNRQNVYRHLGFSDFLDKSYFDAKDTKGMYISESQTFDHVIAEFDKHLTENPGVPFLEAVITIQNHGPYYGKYGAVDETLFSLTGETDPILTDNDINALSNYFYGLRDCDKELYKLTSYLDTVGEPVVVVYFGDHLPSFSSNIYNALMPARHDDPYYEATKMYQTPFIIWGNGAYKNDGATERDLGVVSSNYFGAMLLSFLGFDGLDPFFDHINSMRETYPVIFEQRYIDSSKNIHALDSAAKNDINFYRSWEYYRLFNN